MFLSEGEQLMQGLAVREEPRDEEEDEIPLRRREGRSGEPYGEASSLAIDGESESEEAEECLDPLRCPRWVKLLPRDGLLIWMFSAC